VSGPPGPVGAVWPVTVRPSHIAAPDLPGQGLPEISPAFLGTWGPRFRNSTGRVRRPRSQLSDPGRMPRPPEGKRGDYELRDAKGLDTLAGGTPVCMYRQRPPGPPRERDEPAGGARSQHRVGWTACSRRERACKSFSARVGTQWARPPPTPRASGGSYSCLIRARRVARAVRIPPLPQFSSTHAAD
jgi:hypothetical protein